MKRYDVNFESIFGMISSATGDWCKWEEVEELKRAIDCRAEERNKLFDEVVELKAEPETKDHF